MSAAARSSENQPRLGANGEQSPPPALPHGELSEVLPGIFFVTGTVRMPGPVPVSFSRNMTVVREGERLVLINSLRLNDDGLKQLDALGKVTDVVRLAAFHGMDDPFYKERYAAKVSVVKRCARRRESQVPPPSRSLARRRLSSR